MNRKTLSFFLATLVFSSCFLSLDAAKPEKKPTQAKWELAIASMFRDEAPYLREWIEFHRLAGVQHFYLYNHLSKDNYLEVLQPYIDSGLVELTNWLYEPDSVSSWRSIQNNAFREVVKKASGKTDWLAIMDTDEFLFTKDGTPIQDYLRPILKEEKYSSKVGGVYVKWLMFGTSKVAKIPAKQTLIETLTMCAVNRSNIGKTICRPDKVSHVNNPHKCKYNKGFEILDEQNTKFLDNLQMNHYWTRDEDFLINVKLARKEKMGQSQKDSLERESRFNDTTDSAILRYVPALRKSLGLAPKQQTKNAVSK